MVSNRLRSTLLARSRWRNARWMVIAPHADDETLGCGALIAETAAAGNLAAVVFLTDGGSSHRCDTANQRQRLVAVRQHEARAALRILAPTVTPPVFLGWPDAEPLADESAGRDKTVALLRAVCMKERVDAIAVTGRDEPHCDHVAAYEVAHSVAKGSARPTRLFEYIVWAPTPPGADFIAVCTAPLAVGRRRLALAQHRSQLTPLFGAGFRLPTSMRRMASCDLLYTRVH